MEKFKVGDRVRIIKGYWEGTIGTVAMITTADPVNNIETLYNIRTEEKPFGMPYWESLLEKVEDSTSIFEKSLVKGADDGLIDEAVSNLPIDYDYFAEMATVCRRDDERILIAVNSETARPGVAYFKVYNRSSWSNATAIARLHFKDTEMEYHERDKKKAIPVWNIPESMIKKVIEILSSPLDGDPDHTYWQFACYQWNYENNLIPPNSMERYLNGDYDSKYTGDDIKAKTYVPSTQEMPPTWKFNPIKAKGKKVVN